MGTDIKGWVEVYDQDLSEWFSAVHITHLVDRSYSMFSMLFGRRNIGEYVPIAAARGLPLGISEEVYTAEPSFGVGQTWILWSETKAIDWDEYEYSRTSTPPPPEGIPKQRRELVPPSWTLVFDLMRRLAEDYGDEGVRLVVWFDS